MNCILSKSMQIEILAPVSENMTLNGNRVIEVRIVKMKAPEWALIPYDLCSYKREFWHTVAAHKENSM